MECPPVAVALETVDCAPGEAFEAVTWFRLVHLDLNRPCVVVGIASIELTLNGVDFTFHCFLEQHRSLHVTGHHIE